MELVFWGHFFTSYVNLYGEIYLAEGFKWIFLFLSL